MSCPRCGFTEATSPSCPRCGVVFAKLREERPRPAPPPRPTSTPRADPAKPASSWAIWAGVLAIALCALAVGWVQARKPAAPPVVSAAPTVPADQATEASAEVPAFAEAPTAVPDAPALALPAAGLTAAEHAAVQALITKVHTKSIGEAEVAEADALFTRHPDDPNVQKLLMESLVTHASAHAERRRYQEAIALLRRAAALPWAEHRVRAALLNTLVNAADWPGTEQYARELVRLNPGDADAWYTLGYALFRLDRNREAVEALKTCNELRGDSRAQALLARLEKAAHDEQGMTAQNVSHFHVRYNGEEHAEVGREIVQALERHYATLVVSLDHRPQNAIPVILFSSENYHEAAGAPAWAGGSFHPDDGRIRMPIGGLTRSLTRDIDETLMHELTHAFVYDKARGLVPRDVNEGFAQYMEGHRLSQARLTQLARREIGGVHGYYLEALSFVEYLIAMRGLGGMNDLFKAMADTGSVDDAFRQVHGRDYKSVRAAWKQRLAQQHGS